MRTPREGLEESFAELLQYRGSEAYAQFVRVLMDIESCYDEDFRTVTMEALARKQGAAAQARILREQLIDYRQGDLPKI